MVCRKAARIPDPNWSISGQLNECALLLAEHLIRLQNPPKHTRLHPLVQRLFDLLPAPSVETRLDKLFAGRERSLDWVTAAKRLPAQALLDGFGLHDDTTERLITLLDTLVTIMLPGKTVATVEALNAAAEEACMLVEQQIIRSERLKGLIRYESNDEMRIVTANMIGLLIQSYDAGCGLLSHGLLYSLRQRTADYTRLITEVLRYDPPVHNTRRILTQSIRLDDAELKADDSVLLVLAAANRDPRQFADPDQFDPQRSNNGEHLTFGAGIHRCLARYYMVQLVVDTLAYVAEQCPGLMLLTERIEFEPLVNVRLPRSIQIAF